jgi:hypothetical protein
MAPVSGHPGDRRRSPHNRYVTAHSLTDLTGRRVNRLATTKVWLLSNTVFANPLWELYVDVTPDGTTPTNRIGHHSPEWSDIWVEEHPSYLGWMLIKARLELTGAEDVDGSFTVHMTDGNNGDELFPLGDFTMIRVQDLTIEQV